MALTIGEIAALIHKDMCEDESNGYSWSPRFGEDGLGIKTLTIDGRKYQYDRGSYECGTSVKTAWAAVFKGTKYEHALDNYVYTGNLKDVFLSTGLFEWKPMSFLACPGDLYLNITNHVAMCQTQEPDVLSEFCINEFGEVYGGKVGDQTGKESYVHAYYDYSPGGWDGIVHAKQITMDELLGEAKSETKTEAKKETKSKTSKKRLNGIDISSWQGDIDVSKVDADFVIVKVSGGTSYVNDKAHGEAQDWRDIANKVLKSGKLLGLYHYACEYNRAYTGKSEAKFFLEQIKGFEGKAVMCLDWEAHAKNQPISYAKTWLDEVAKATGSTPMFYAEAGYINSVDCSSIKKYPLWMASYLYRYEYGSGYVDDPDNIYGFGAWDKMAVYQWASTRYISGYSGRLDVNVFYGTADDWKKLMGKAATSTESASTAQKPSTGATSTTTSKKPVKYRSSTDKNGKKWLSVYSNIERDGYSGQMGVPMRWLAIDGVERYRVCTKGDKKRGIKGGWLPWVSGYDIKDLDKGCAGDGTDIIGVQVDDESVCYATHVMGLNKWYSDMHGLVDAGGSGDNFAGDLANSIDAFRAKRL